ncbi:MAG: hypothetical protein ACK40G_17025 [Cytophagaceae bacterium]
MEVLDIKDLLLTPVYITIIYLFAYIYKNRFIKNKDIVKFFIPALTLKILGAVALGLIYHYYYAGGDTFMYYADINSIYKTFIESPLDGLHLIFGDFSEIKMQQHTLHHFIYFLHDKASYFIIRIGALISLFTFSTYTVIGIFFSLISFIGVWNLYTSLCSLYPSYYKGLSFACFFVPSVFFWGSGLMKDTLCFGALCMLYHNFSQIFIFKRNYFRNILIGLLTIYILYSIKIYILLCFIPAALFYAFTLFNHKIRSSFLRTTIKPLVIIISITLGFILSKEIAEENERYNINSIAITAKATSEWISYVSKKEGGTYYDLGEYEASLLGMLSKFPQAVWVTLFRPYLWESRNIVMVLSAFESLGFFLFTFYIILKARFKFFKYIMQDPFLQFSFLFSITFAFAVGISTFNFGTLVRYKIPLMPFYLSACFIIYYKLKTPRKMKRTKQL